MLVMNNRAVGKVACAGAMIAIVGSFAAAAGARNPAWELVPPPPPTPVLNVPPPPVQLPYSYAETGAPINISVLSPTMPPAPTPFPTPGTGRPTPHPQPVPQPRPIGVRPNPQLNIAYAMSHGFGTPRASYDRRFGSSAGAVEAFPAVAPAAPVNTWFDASLRWYAQHINAQRFYSELAARPEYGVPTNGYAAASGMFEGVLPKYVTPKAVAHHGKGHRSHRHHARHGRRVIASR